MKGWAPVTVAYPDVYVIENLSVVTYRSSSRFSCCFLDYIVQDMTREKQEECKVSGFTTHAKLVAINHRVLPFIENPKEGGGG